MTEREVVERAFEERGSDTSSIVPIKQLVAEPNQDLDHHVSVVTK